MRVLVSVASKHGATGEIGEIIGGVLRDAQMDIVSEAPERVRSIDGYDAVILGSAVYAGRWMGSARSFAERHEAALVTRPVWLFSSGPIGDPPMPAGDVDEATEIAEWIGAREHRTFAGRLDRDRLGVVERSITAVVRAPDGDFRDLDAVRAWANEIVTGLAPRMTMAS